MFYLLITSIRINLTKIGIFAALYVSLEIERKDLPSRFQLEMRDLMVIHIRNIS